jgi:hypothetical protein
VERAQAGSAAEVRPINQFGAKVRPTSASSGSNSVSRAAPSLIAASSSRVDRLGDRRRRERQESSERRRVASILQASAFRSDVTVFRLNARPRPKTGSYPAFRRNTAACVCTIEAAHNPEVAGSNPAPATSKGPWRQGLSLPRRERASFPRVTAWRRRTPSRSGMAEWHGLCDRRDRLQSLAAASTCRRDPSDSLTGAPRNANAGSAGRRCDPSEGPNLFAPRAAVERGDARALGGGRTRCRGNRPELPVFMPDDVLARVRDRDLDEPPADAAPRTASRASALRSRSRPAAMRDVRPVTTDTSLCSPSRR